MARRKKTSAKDETAEDTAGGPGGAERAGPRFPLVGYVVINVIAWAFLGAVVAFIAWWLKEDPALRAQTTTGRESFTLGDQATTGLGGICLVLAGAFTLASIFDALYDRLGPIARGKPPGGEGDGEGDLEP